MDHPHPILTPITSNKTVRDEIAISVMKILIREFVSRDAAYDGNSVAEHCYQVADSMMKARQGS